MSAEQPVPSLASVGHKTADKASASKTDKTTVNVKPQPHDTPKPDGGADQVEGLEANLGHMLFDGNRRFQVLAFQRCDTYKVKVPGHRSRLGEVQR